MNEGREAEEEERRTVTMRRDVRSERIWASCIGVEGSGVVLGFGVMVPGDGEVWIE